MGRNDEKWVNNYSSNHSILLVGEGDFSFSLSLALAFGHAFNIVATSLDSYGELIRKYKNAKSNVATLQMMGASVLHGVDATRMKLYPDLTCRRFDRIVYNFPHAGFHGRETNHSLIRMHRSLVLGFLRNASRMLFTDGEIHVNHKVESPYNRWAIEDLGKECSLFLAQFPVFNIDDYPCYRNKRGSGSRCDSSFRLGECRTFIFQLSHVAAGKKPSLVLYHHPRTSPTFQEIPVVPHNHELSVSFERPCPPLPAPYACEPQPLMHSQTFRGVRPPISHTASQVKTFGGTFQSAYHVVHEALVGAFKAYASAFPGESLEELHRVSSEWRQFFLHYQL